MLPMQPSDIFFNEHGRLRSGWRLAVFGGIFLVATSFVSAILVFALVLAYGPDKAQAILEGSWGFAAQEFIFLVAAVGIGFLCQKLFEDLPPRALGWALHTRWLRDWFIGSLFGAGTLILAALVATISGGFSFTLTAPQMFPAVLQTLVFSCLVFIFAAASEEALFRGYPLQTMTRAKLILVGIVITSLAFALAHQGNPNQDISKAVRVLAFTNTALAGVWLAVAYLRTRSLWLPLGLHWAWNWMMAAVLGLPVSGITNLTPHPLMRAKDLGPVWVTGGAYGIEGGAACTVALLLSTILIWRTKLLSPTQEMKELTSHEIPKQPQPRWLPD
ncbi:MAG: CPBP family intramembrane metalloprotease [Acidobacteria bacterium]|nr:CPBP family intramembrane metalloprotease [Acidobacteriota bacterium]